MGNLNVKNVKTNPFINKEGNMENKLECKITEEENLMPSEQGQVLAYVRMHNGDKIKVCHIAAAFNKSERQVQRIIDGLIAGNKLTSTTGDSSLKAYFEEK